MKQTMTTAKHPPKQRKNEAKFPAQIAKRNIITLLC